MIAETYTGTVKCFDDETGEGRIIPDDGGEDLFVYFTGVAPLQGGAFRVLVEGARVSYEVVAGKTVTWARNVCRVD